MPNGRGFASKSQQKFMFATHPKVAKRFASETSDYSKLPEKAPKKKKGLVKFKIGGKGGY